VSKCSLLQRKLAKVPIYDKGMSQKKIGPDSITPDPIGKRQKEETD